MDSKDQRGLIRNLTTGSVSKQLITFATPLLLSGLLQMTYNMADMVIVGRYVGSAGLSAVTVGGEVMHFLTFIAMGFSNAGQIIISQYVGAGKEERLRKLIGTLFTFLLGASLVMTVLCLLLMDQILVWMNTPVETLAFAHDYIYVSAWGLFFIYGYNLVSAIMRGMGDSKRPFMFIAIAATTNVVLDIIFVGFLGWEVFGAAFATVMSQMISFLWAISYLYKRRDGFGFDFKPASFRIDADSFRPLIRLGIPMVLQSASISFSKLFITSWVNSYGVTASALTGIGNKLQTITAVFASALSTAGGSMIAQCIGAEKYDRVPRIINISFLLNGIVAAALSFVTLWQQEWVFGLFTQDAAVIEMAYSYLPVAVLLYASCILRPPMTALINGTGNSRLNLAIALLDGIFVRIGLAMFLGLVLDWGIYGFWYGNAFSSFMPFFIGGTYYLSGKWRTQRYVLEKKQLGKINWLKQKTALTLLSVLFFLCSGLIWNDVLFP